MVVGRWTLTRSSMCETQTLLTSRNCFTSTFHWLNVYRSAVASLCTYNSFAIVFSCLMLTLSLASD